MSHSNIKNCGGSARRVLAKLLAGTALACAAGAASAAVPGITGTTINLQANQGYNSQPDGMQIYSWGYGCAVGFNPSFLPLSFAAAGVPQFCPGSTAGGTANMQMPGPTIIVTEGAIVTVTLTNNLPPAAGNTSIVFPGFTKSTSSTVPGSVTTSGGTAGLMTMEAATGTTVTYVLNTTGKAGMSPI